MSIVLAVSISSFQLRMNSVAFEGVSFICRIKRCHNLAKTCAASISLMNTRPLHCHTNLNFEGKLCQWDTFLLCTFRLCIQIRQCSSDNRNLPAPHTYQSSFHRKELPRLFRRMQWWWWWWPEEERLARHRMSVAWRELSAQAQV